MGTAPVPGCPVAECSSDYAGCRCGPVGGAAGLSAPHHSTAVEACYLLPEPVLHLSPS